MSAKRLIHRKRPVRSEANRDSDSSEDDGLSIEAAEGMHNSLEVEDLGSKTFEMSGVVIGAIRWVLLRNTYYMFEQ